MTLRTSPYEYETNTDEVDALGLNAAPDLTGSEAVVSAECELRHAYTRTDVSLDGLPSPATVASNVVTQAFDARVLEPARYEWTWTVTLNTGAVRSYESMLNVKRHD